MDRRDLIKSLIAGGGWLLSAASGQATEGLAEWDDGENHCQIAQEKFRIGSVVTWNVRKRDDIGVVVASCLDKQGYCIDCAILLDDEGKRWMLRVSNLRLLNVPLVERLRQKREAERIA